MHLFVALFTRTEYKLIYILARQLVTSLVAICQARLCTVIYTCLLVVTSLAVVSASAFAVFRHVERRAVQ